MYIVFNPTRYFVRRVKDDFEHMQPVTSCPTHGCKFATADQCTALYLFTILTLVPKPTRHFRDSVAARSLRSLTVINVKTYFNILILSTLEMDILLVWSL